VKELVYGGFGRITKEVWAKAEDHVLKIEKEYGKENCIDRSEIPPIITITFHYCCTHLKFDIFPDFYRQNRGGSKLTRGSSQVNLTLI
jgi:hypothetical protein